MDLIFYFILLNFMVSFAADLLLNYLSKVHTPYINTPRPIAALKSYFAHYDNALVTAVYAGLTVVTILLLTLVLSNVIWGFAVPRTLTQLLRFLAVAVPLGYGADVFIYKYKVFGHSLTPYYNVAGAGVYGALAFAGAILISYTLIGAKV